jgi:hypothetical protein
MIICPLSQDECSKRIILRPKTAFLMTPSKTKRNDALKRVISRISSELQRQGFDFLDGCSLVELGGTVCKICSTMQGCAIGIGFYHPDIQADAVSNIFWEMGMLQGWGRPALLVATKKEDLPSDFTGESCIFYEDNNRYISKFRDLLTGFKEREKYYVEILADEAIRTADYEKAIKYYQEAYLISGNRQILNKMRRLKKDLEARRLPIKLRKRLINTIDTFQKDVKYKKGTKM